MPFPSKTLLMTAATFVASASLASAETYVTGILTGYGAASNTPAGDSTVCCGLQGSEHSATYDDPGTVASDNDVYPVGTKVYVPGLAKYFVVQDSCDQCSQDAQNGQAHIDLWIGPTGYQDYNSLLACAESDTNGNAVFIIDPAPNYVVDSTPLMDANGNCDGNVDYSRTTPQTTGGGSAPTPSSTSSAAPSNPTGGDCSWEGHCQGASCSSDDDCSDPFSCQNGVCT